MQDNHTSSLLSMQWNVENDTLEVFCCANNEVPKRLTQRGAVFSFVALVFEPLRFFAPLVMRMWILLKTIWAITGQQWDDKIEEEDEEKFLEWVRELPELTTMPLKRWNFNENYKKIDMNTFSDASVESMCIVAYLRGNGGDGVEFS